MDQQAAASDPGAELRGPADDVGEETRLRAPGVRVRSSPRGGREALPVVDTVPHPCGPGQGCLRWRCFGYTIVNSYVDDAWVRGYYNGSVNSNVSSTWTAESGILPELCPNLHYHVVTVKT